jgi:Lrp/AsnC family transcriptional regulator for asnA, asnC and gidA
MMLGFKRQAMIGIRCNGDLNEAADAIADIDGVEYVVITAGSLDILAEVVAADDEQLLNILTRIRSVPTVISTEIFLYLKLRKQTYAWGTR